MTMSNIEFTSSQKAAIYSFRSFLNGSDQVFILKGAAGTGKTTLLAEFIRILNPEKRLIKLMAPTGRAAHIIGQKTGVSALTIHKSIYSLSALNSIAKKGDPEEDDNIHAKFGLRKNDDPQSTVYIVDESSLISDIFSEHEAFSFGSGKLLSDLFKYIGNRKIIFVGDYAQLPPIGMNFSPALDKSYLEEFFNCTVSEFFLREVVRQAHGSVLLDNVTKIRDNIESKSFAEFKLLNDDDFLTEKENLLIPYFRQSNTRPHVRSIIITYSNKQAMEYNQAIRTHYYGEDVPRLVKGDLLIIARNNYAYDRELFNGNIVQVESCTLDSEIESRHVRISLGKGKIETVELRFRKAVIRFLSGNKPVSVKVTILDNFLDDEAGSIGGLLARGLIVDFNNRLPKEIKNRLPEIKRLMRSETLTIQEQQLCATYNRLLQKDPYYNSLICKYGYALTCHKAQGGEWENVFVDMGRYGGCANEEYFRWAYTALTRASKKIWHFRSPDFDYISNIVVEPIQLSNNIKISTQSDEINFCNARFKRIKKLADKYGIDVDENLSRQYQHWISFSNKEGETAIFILWYRTKGYNGSEQKRSSSSDKFAEKCSEILLESTVPDDVIFNAPLRPFAEKLVSYIKPQLKEFGIHLLDITQEQYHDIFHLRTNGLAKIAFYYNDKGLYTHMRLQSSLGSDDAKLETIRRLFL